MTIAPTGTQYSIRSGDYAAVVTEVGAALRSLTWRGEEILWTFGPNEIPKGFAGATLAPWPNRIRDGKYAFDGEELLLPVNEAGADNALHGLMCALPFSLVRRQPDEILLAAVLYPQIGWNGVLRLEVSFQLSDEGLQVSFLATNEGENPFPFGYGAHPYLGFERVDDVTITAPFTRHLQLDDRMLPTGLVDVDGVHSRHVPTEVGDTVLDDAYTGAGPDGWAVTVAAPERTVTVWGDETMPWCQMHTRPERTSLAVEPMTCGPDAFNDGPTHADLIRIPPGEAATGAWGMSVG